MIQKLKGLLLQRCPCCVTGRMFSGLFRMNARCSHCGLNFEPEPGYYIGALYMNYGLGLVLIAPLMAWMIWVDYSAHSIGAAAVVALAILSPVVFRYARLLWIYMDLCLFDTAKCRPQTPPPAA